MHAETMPHLCMIFEAIGPYSAIAKVALADVRIALAAGYRVSVVANQLDESLHGQVEWLKLRKFSRGFALQWLTGRRFIRQALGSRQFDIVHGHQPQIVDLCDVFQCHFLTRVAYEARTLEGRKSVRGRIIRTQQQIVLYAEDYFYKRRNSRTRMLYNSEMTRRDFHRLYGRFNNEEILLYPAPAWDPPTGAARRAARLKYLGGDFDGIVVGFLGGIQIRKGYRRVIDGLAADNPADIFLLLGGQYTENFAMPELKGRARGIGLVKDVAEFYAACDVLVVPSVYESFGLVVFEAAAHGVPVVVTPQVGVEPHVREFGAGLTWNSNDVLPNLVRRAHAERSSIRDGAKRMVDCHSLADYGAQLLKVYDDVLADRGHARVSQSTRAVPQGAQVQ